MNKAQLQYFTKQLVQWHSVDNNRDLPWKEEQDPYKIWLSEVILQQTRAQQGLPYYLKFTAAYPTIQHMARAEDEEVFKLWQGLGYYNRCRNMLATARYVTDELGGDFPDSYEHIAALKGVGPYTAAEIASFACGLPHAVLDGNVYRVLSRYFGIETPIDSTAGKKQFTQLADSLLDKTNSAAYNQAIMDLGATVCKPKAPICQDCPLHKKCFALQHGLISDLPIKSKKLKIQTRYFHYILFIHQNKLWLHKRTEKDIWQNLYEPYLVEYTNELDKMGLLTNLNAEGFTLTAKDVVFAASSTQRLTHRIIESHFYVCQLQNEPMTALQGGIWVNFAELDKYAFPKSVVSFLEKKSYF